MRNVKIAINFDEMRSNELLRLARASIKEFNERNLQQFKIIEK